MGTMIRVLLSDDQPIVGEGVHKLCAYEEGLLFFITAVPFFSSRDPKGL